MNADQLNRELQRIRAMLAALVIAHEYRDGHVVKFDPADATAAVLSAFDRVLESLDTV